MSSPGPALNRLSTASSLYLRQHATNPVDWYPWGEEALARARDEDRPILLSIGYSACHWCHVMAHESFEDTATAALMNRLFVNVKVDREERPDLDRIYQSSHQLLAQRPGGWPLTLFLSPRDLTPFFAGTYFPSAPRHGLPAFRDLLQNIAQVYQEQRDAIQRQNLSLRNALAALNPSSTGHSILGSGPLSLARQQLANSYDEDNGGFGQPPKFPHPASIERLMRHWSATAIAGQGDERALHMGLHTLERMALGGIDDQLGGGFCRYSVDDSWTIPHFEKMLYDNGPLLALYVDAWQASGNGLFREVAERTAAWVLTEMESSDGGYYSALDADSEDGEGRFYTWTPTEIQAVLKADEYPLFARRYGLDQAANFEGRWHLHSYVQIDVLAQEFDISSAQTRAQLDHARSKLLEARRQRVPPARDEKILTAWNALMIKGMARAGNRLQHPDLLDSAFRAADFLSSRLWRDGRLLASYRDGRAYLDDYAYLIDALLELLQARWRRRDLDFCITLADLLLEHFQDRESGGFYFTADDHETLIHRPKPLGDDSTPAGNGIAAFALGRLGHLLGESRYLEAAERTLKMAWNNIRELPYAHCSLLLALEEQLTPPELLILRGSGPELERWHARAANCYAPARLCIAIPDTEQDLPGTLAQYMPQGDTVGYLCRGTRCQPPISDYSTLDQTLQGSEPGGRKGDDILPRSG